MNLLSIFSLAMVAVLLNTSCKGQSLEGKKVAILSTMGFEKVELELPMKALQEAGATVHIISPDGKPIRALEFPEWGEEMKADKSLAEVKPSDYDALYLPGGIINPDILRTNDAAVAFVAEFAKSGKPMASMCHGPSTMITAGVVKGKKMTSWHSIKADLVNAGAKWVDESVVVDGNLVTSRNPGDIPRLNEEMIKLIASK